MDPNVNSVICESLFKKHSQHISITKEAAKESLSSFFFNNVHCFSLNVIVQNENDSKQTTKLLSLVQQCTVLNILLINIQWNDSQSPRLIHEAITNISYDYGCALITYEENSSRAFHFPFSPLGFQNDKRCRKALCTNAIIENQTYRNKCWKATIGIRAQAFITQCIFHNNFLHRVKRTVWGST